MVHYYPFPRHGFVPGIAAWVGAQPIAVLAAKSKKLPAKIPAGREFASRCNTCARRCPRLSHSCENDLTKSDVGGPYNNGLWLEVRCVLVANRDAAGRPARHRKHSQTFPRNPVYSQGQGKVSDAIVMPYYASYRSNCSTLDSF